MVAQPGRRRSIWGNTPLKGCVQGLLLRPHLAQLSFHGAQFLHVIVPLRLQLGDPPVQVGDLVLVIVGFDPPGHAVLEVDGGRPGGDELVPPLVGLFPKVILFRLEVGYLLVDV